MQCQDKKPPPDKISCSNMARVSNTQSKVISGALVTGREYYADNMLRRTSFLLLAGMCLAAAAVPAESDDGGFAATQIAVEPAVPVARDGLVTMQVVGAKLLSTNIGPLGQRGLNILTEVN